MKIYIFILLFFCLSKSYSQDNLSYKIIVTLDEAPFKTLFLHDYTADRNIFIPGELTSEYTWEFTIPDSIASNSESLMLFTNPYDSSNNTSTSIRFIRQVENKEVKVVNIGFENRINYIYGKHIGKALFKNKPISTDLSKLDSIVVGDLIIHDFKLTKNDSTTSDIEVRSKEPFFAWFMSSKKVNKPYNDYLSSYIELSKSYPDSKYLLMNLANNLTNFKSREDVKLLYDNLSNKHSETKWNFRIKNFIQDEFINTQLLNLETDNYEGIVEDFEKFNLIIFTASWCTPCIEEIPILKTIYKDLEEYVNFTYITIDKKSQIDNFQKLLRNHEIPWRSLYQGDDNEIIKNRYFVSSIPHVMLVSPSKKFEILDIRKKDDKDKMYKKVLNETKQKK